MVFYGIVGPLDGEREYDDDGNELSFKPENRLTWHKVAVDHDFVVCGETGKLQWDGFTEEVYSLLKGPWAISTCVEDHAELNGSARAEGDEAEGDEAEPCDYIANNDLARDHDALAIMVKTKRDRDRLVAHLAGTP